MGILGHELGHWKLGHSKKQFIVTQLYFGFIFYCFSKCYHNYDLYSAFGFNDDNRSIPIIIALTLFFQTLWSPVDTLISFLTTVYTRKCEFEADAFSCDLGYSQELSSGICKNCNKNLQCMLVDKIYAMVHWTHPPTVERMSFIQKYMKEKENVETLKLN